MKTKVQTCALAEKHHRAAIRQYAHTLHRRNTICICEAFLDLPATLQCGILLHEIGHLIEPDEDNERQIDRIAEEWSGIAIKRRDTTHGKRLECIARADVPRALKVLRHELA
jgi:hypothetical protein